MTRQRLSAMLTQYQLTAALGKIQLTQRAHTEQYFLAIHPGHNTRVHVIEQDLPQLQCIDIGGEAIGRTIGCADRYTSSSGQVQTPLTREWQQR